MTRLTNIVSSLVILVIGGLILPSCTEPITGTSTNAPSDLTAAATSSSTIVVNWKRDPADTLSDTIIVSDTVGGLKVTRVIVPATPLPDTTWKLTGLDTGVSYTISVHSIGGISPTLHIMTNPPSGLLVLSLDSATISIYWTRAQGDASPDTVIATPNAGSPVFDTIAAPNAGPVSIRGLSEGIVYSISVHSTAGSSIPLQWMTAERTMGIKIYETNDTVSGRPRALVLGAHTTHSDSLSGLKNADFVLESIPDSILPSGISLVSGKVYNPLWNATRIDSSATDHHDYVVGGLDADYTSRNYQADQANSSANSYDIPNDNNYASNGSRVLIVTTANNHLALVEVVPDVVTSKLYSVTTADTSGNTYKYVTLNVSYQSAVNEPYAARGRASHSSSGPVKRISAH